MHGRRRRGSVKALRSKLFIVAFYLNASAPFVDVDVPDQGRLISIDACINKIPGRIDIDVRIDHI